MVDPLLVDLDGVLVDFVRGSLALHGKSLPHGDVRWNFPEQIGIPDADFWKPLGFDFWAGLDWLPGGKALLTGIEKLVGSANVLFYSSPCNTPGAVEGKIEWLRRNVPAFAKQWLLSPCKTRLGGGGLLLVDDHEANVLDWRARGGTAVLVPQPWNSRRSELVNDEYVVDEVLANIRSRL